MIGKTAKGLIAGHTGEGPGSNIAVYAFLGSQPTQTLGCWGAEESGMLEKELIRQAR
jgi:hypothetical protein